MPRQTRPNSSIIRRACGRSAWVSMTTPPPRLMSPEFASHTRFFSFRTAKQLSLTCCSFTTVHRVLEIHSYQGERSMKGIASATGPMTRPGQRGRHPADCYTFPPWRLIVYRNSARQAREAPSGNQRAACRHGGRDQRPHGGRRRHRAHRAGCGAAPADAASGAPGDRASRGVDRRVLFDQSSRADAHERPQGPASPTSRSVRSRAGP